MNVAIIGAGVSGLSCAFELEKYGITPTIFEKRSQVGEASGYAGIWINLLARNNKDPVKYLMDEYGLKLKPLASIEESILISPHKKVTATGTQGYIIKRGVEKHSLENQILSQIKTQINFDSFIDINDIKNKFDYIVVATADSVIPKKENVWTDTFISKVRTATVLGDFNINSTTVWFNEIYSNKGFCYLVPSSATEASLVLIINDVVPIDMDYYWEKFLIKENISYTVTQYCDTEHTCGFAKPLMKDNIYYTGCSAGLTDDLLGVGSVNAIESGIYAAQSIVNGTDYIEMIKPLYNNIIKLHEVRKLFNTLSNAGFDKVVSLIGTPVLKQLIYKINFFKAYQMAPIAKIINKLNDKS